MTALFGRLSKRTRYYGRIALIALPLLVLAFGEFILGLWQETALIRNEARMFRAEAALLRTGTLNLVPGVHHQYFPLDRGSTAIEGPRLFRTAEDGTVLTPDRERGSERRILFLGGSTTESNEVDEPFRFPAVAEQLFRKAGVPVVSINAGVRGHTTQDNINALLNRPGFRDAEIVVLMENINDRLRLSLRGNYDGFLATDSPTSSSSVLESARSLVGSTWDYLSYRSNILFLIRSVGGRFNAWTGEQRGLFVDERNINFVDENATQSRRLFEQNLRVFVGVVRSLGKEPVLMTQALGIDSRAQSEFNDDIRAVAANLGVLLIDLDARLGGDRSWAFLSDNIHLNNVGSQAVGQIVAEALGPLVGAGVGPDPLNTGIVSVGELLSKCRAPTEHIQASPSSQIVGAAGRYPSFSPDGRWLLFHNWSAGRDRLRVLDTKEQKLIDLSPTTTEVGERHPAFLAQTNDGFEVVFGSGFDENLKDSFERLMIRRWPSMATKPLLSETDLGGAIPTVQGADVVFPGFTQKGADRVPDLYRYNRSERRLERLTRSPWEEWRPTISPDGTVYFIAKLGSIFDIYRLRANSSEQEPFYQSSSDKWDPSVSPDGRWLAFASKERGNWSIYIISINAPSERVRVTQDFGDQWDPAWHPSGRMLAYAARTSFGSKIMGTCVFGVR